MAEKEPVLLIVAIEPDKLRWFLAGATMDGELLPLLRSHDGNLEPYLDAPLDEQVSFLRHRFAGTLQRGFDRLWGKQKKPVHIAFVSDRHFEEDSPELTDRVAEHFTVWMLNPPVTFHLTDLPLSSNGCRPEKTLAGEMDSTWQGALSAGWAKLLGAIKEPEGWELVPNKKK